MSLPAAGMPTVSTMRPSASCSSSLVVPSGPLTRWCTMERPVRTPAAWSCSRHGLGTCQVRERVARQGAERKARWAQ